MRKTAFRRMGLSACLLATLMLGISPAALPLSSSAYASAGSMPGMPAGFDTQNFLNNPFAQQGGVGNPALNLLTNPGSGVTPDALAQSFGQNGGMQASIPQATEILGNIQSGVQSGQMSPQMGSNFITALAGNMLSPQALQGLTTMPNAGNIPATPQGIQQIFSNPAVQQFLGGNQNNPQAQASFLDQIMTGGVQNGGRNMSPQAAQEFVNQVTQAAPGLGQALQGAGGGDPLAAIQQALSNPSGLLGMITGMFSSSSSGGGSSSSSSSSSSGSPGGGRDKDKGNYELESKTVPKKFMKEPCGNCSGVVEKISKDYTAVRQKIKDEFIKHRNWMVNTYWLEHVLPALMLMAEQLTVIGIAQVEMIGAMLDAKHQLETQRLFQQLMAQAHKDYHPSEGMCTFGTSVRSLAASGRKSDLTQVALAGRMMQRQAMNGDTISTESVTSDLQARITKFTQTYCQKADNGGTLQYLCKDAGSLPERRNIDVDFTRNVESRLTLDIDMNDSRDSELAAAREQLDELGGDAIVRQAMQQRIADLEAAGAQDSPDKEDLFALSANLFAHNIAPRIEPDELATPSGQVYQDAAERYLDLRAVFAKRSVAQNSFAALTAMRASGDEGSAPYTKALIKELGVTSEEEINKFLGEKPSYFAQMEVLTKKIYQNPTFYTELYDKPVNVERKGAAIEAISLMQDRDLYNSLLRSEAVLSVLLETMLAKEQAKVINALPDTGAYGAGGGAAGGGGGGF